MAVIVHEDALKREQALTSRGTVDLAKLAIWIAAAVLPWTAIIAGVRLAISALG
jgi:hypothetical protein